MVNSFLINLIEEGHSFSDILSITKFHKSKLLSELVELKNDNVCEKVSELIDNNYLYNSYSGKQSFLFIADLHWGNALEKREYMDIVYNYAIKEGISEIYVLGDIIDFQTKKAGVRLNTYNKQYEHFIKNYPYDKNIHNHILLGNHDYRIQKKKFDLNSKLEKDRKDITSLGFKKSYIGYEDKIIHLGHDISKYRDNPVIVQPDISFVGHAHKYEIKEIGGRRINPKVYVPHLFVENVTTQGDTNPGFLRVDIDNDVIIGFNVIEKKSSYLKEEKVIKFKKVKKK